MMPQDEPGRGVAVAFRDEGEAARRAEDLGIDLKLVDHTEGGVTHVPGIEMQGFLRGGPAVGRLEARVRREGVVLDEFLVAQVEDAPVPGAALVRGLAAL